MVRVTHLRNQGCEVLKFRCDDFYESNFYFIPDLGLMVDAGCKLDRDSIKVVVDETIGLDAVRVLVCTHFHLDHCGCADLFPKAKHYAGAEEIAFFKKDAFGAVLDEGTAQLLKTLTFSPASELKIEGLKVIPTPGHTLGSICLLYRGFLFTGDTLFANGVGRTDLPSSIPKELGPSLKKLSLLPFDVLCPGHDY